MIQSIISTVGTSLISNIKRLASEANNALSQLSIYYERKQWIQLGKELAKIDPNDRICGAEINSVAQLLERESFSDVRSLYFCVSDTGDGQAVGKIIEAYYNECRPELKVNIKTIEDLSSDEPQRFKIYGLRYLVRGIGEIVQESGGSQYVALNCTGGYKAQVAIACLIGQALDITIYYKHEQFRSIISFPTMPISFNYSLLENYGSLLTQLENNQIIEADEKEMEPIRTLLEEVESGDKRLWALAPVGQIFLESFRKRYPVEKTLPKSVPENERKQPSFGNDHHYPNGFKEYVNKIWKETSYIKSCISISYSGQKAITGKTFIQDPTGEIIGTYKKSGFGARFKIITEEINPNEKIAIILDLSKRFCS